MQETQAHGPTVPSSRYVADSYSMFICDTNRTQRLSEPSMARAFIVRAWSVSVVYWTTQLSGELAALTSHGSTTVGPSE